MVPGFYVVRDHKGRGNTLAPRLIVESRPFSSFGRADDWREFIQSEHPKDDVFVIERKPHVTT